MTGYGQYCPVAKAAEVLDQRWMLLVGRELVADNDRFSWGDALVVAAARKTGGVALHAGGADLAADTAFSG